MDYQYLADTVALAGGIMLKSGAETYRVEETVSYMLNATGKIDADVLALATGIIITLKPEGQNVVTVVKRISDRDTNLSNIYEVNAISRDYCKGKITIEEAGRRLTHVERIVTYPDWIQNLAHLLTCACFCVLLGAKPVECLVAGINGLFFVAGIHFNKKLKVRRFIRNMCIALFMSFFTVLACKVKPGMNEEIIIAGSVMPMLPGVAVTNAVRDMLHGDYTSGGARILEALTVAAFIAIGIGFGMAAAKMLIG